MKSSNAALISQADGKSRFLLHPLVLFVLPWALAFSMYAMHLSNLLTFSTRQVLQTVLWIVVPYVLTIVFCKAFYTWAPKTIKRTKRHAINDKEYLIRIERRLHRWFIFWCLLTFVEIVFSGGIPILWIIQGSSKHYNDFGLPVLHVVLNSLLSVLALSEFGIFILLGGKRRLLIPAWLVLWAAVLVSRGFLAVSLLQCGVLWFFLKGARLRTIMTTLALITIFILAFGYIGDLRTGGEVFRALAQPSRNYPDWLPSGFLWFYMYFTTPLGNLVNTSLLTAPINSFLFPNTLYLLFPTVIRNVIYGKQAAFRMGGDLVVDSFNVSTAYIGPLRDFGYFGMAIFSFILGIIAAYLWRKRRTFRDGLLYSIIAQCLALSIFWNFLFYNPFLGQIFWIYFLFRAKYGRQVNLGIVASKV